MERLFHAVISRSAKYQVVKSKLLLSNPPKRNLGWLLGPPPDPGTPEQKIRDRRIAALWVMVATPFLIWSGNLVVSVAVKISFYVFHEVFLFIDRFPFTILKLVNSSPGFSFLQSVKSRLN